MNTDTMGWFLALVISLIGWAQWLYFRKKLDFKHNVNRLLLHALSDLYQKEFIGGCNMRYDGMACHQATPLRELCAPCFGRRIVEDPNGVLNKILEEPGKDPHS